jgi:hypothetical protein
MTFIDSSIKRIPNLVTLEEEITKNHDRMGEI